MFLPIFSMFLQGFQIVKPELINKNEKIFSMRKVIFEQLKKGTLYGVEDENDWFHISTISDLQKINELDL